MFKCQILMVTNWASRLFFCYINGFSATINHIHLYVLHALSYPNLIVYSFRRVAWYFSLCNSIFVDFTQSCNICSYWYLFWVFSNTHTVWLLRKSGWSSLSLLRLTLSLTDFRQFLCGKLCICLFFKTGRMLIWLSNLFDKLKISILNYCSLEPIP